MSSLHEPDTAARPVRGETATVFDIQRFSIHDGPGLRTVVFFKGCSLGCRWCQNPEAVSARPELAYAASRCLPTCDACLAVCPEDAISDDIQARVDWSRCTHCGECAPACPTTALEIVGQPMTPEGLLSAVLRDEVFFEASGGGVTLSGGEAVLRSDFLVRFLPLARQAGLHVTLETAGHYPYRLLEPLLPWLGAILFDLKIVDPARHRLLTGRDNQRIHDNLRRLLDAGAPVSVRMPIIPGHNDDPDSIAEVAEFLLQLGVTTLTLLPYNPMWEAKLSRLCTTRTPLQIPTQPPERYRRLVGSLAGMGITASIEGAV